MKVRAFTTLELSVALVLAALVTGMGYSGYTLFMKHWNTYGKNLDEALELRNLQSTMYREFYLGDSVEKNEDILIINYKNAPVVKYYLGSQNIVREQNQSIDTFKFPVLSVNFTFEGNEQFLPGGKIDRFEIELLYKNEPMMLVYFKEYGRGELMEWNNEYKYQ